MVFLHHRLRSCADHPEIILQCTVMVEVCTKTHSIGERVAHFVQFRLCLRHAKRLALFGIHASPPRIRIGVLRLDSAPAENYTQVIVSRLKFWRL